MARKRAKPYDKIPAEVHGTNSGYVMGCDCDECKEAHNLYHKIYGYAVRNAAKWVRANRPQLWDSFLEDAYNHFDKVRNPVGLRNVTKKPVKSRSWLADYNDRD